MELTIGILKKVINNLPDDTILATLLMNDRFETFTHLKRLLLLQDTTTQKQYLTINKMGSHFTKKGEQETLEYLGTHWDESNII